MTTKKCPHCDPHHGSPARTSWGVRVAPDRDGDGQPTHLIVQPSAGAHVAEEDVEWVRWCLDAFPSGIPGGNIQLRQHDRYPARGA